MFTLLSAITTITEPIRSRLRSEHGIEAIEYALIAALLAAIVVAALALLTPAVDNIFTAIATRLNTAATAVGGGAPAAP